jgi:hypothetical protein
LAATAPTEEGEGKGKMENEHTRGFIQISACSFTKNLTTPRQVQRTFQPWMSGEFEMTASWEVPQCSLVNIYSQALTACIIRKAAISSSETSSNI